MSGHLGGGESQRRLRTSAISTPGLGRVCAGWATPLLPARKARGLEPAGSSAPVAPAGSRPC